MNFPVKIIGLLLLPLLAVVGTVSFAGANDGLIAHWTFDDDPQGTLRNVCGEMFHAACDRKFPRVEGVFGKAIELSGQYRISVAKEFVPSGLTELTFSAWVVPKNLRGYREILRKEDVGRHGESRLLFSFQNDGRFLTLGLNTGGNYAECDAIITPEEILDGNWHFIAGTFDGRFMRVWLDGKEIGSFERQGSLNTVHDFLPISVGRDDIASSRYQTLEQVSVNAPGFIGSSSGTGEYFEGKMDDLRFYSRALSADEISQMYAHGTQELRNGKINEMQISEQKAISLYSKGDTFQETLVATRNKVTENGSPDNRGTVALLRLIRRDFPEEVNHYIMKWQKNPVEVMLLGNDRLQERFHQMETAYFEYLPLTEQQWQYLPQNERTKWERVKEYKDAYEARRKNGVWSTALLYEIVCDMEMVVEQRPTQSERIVLTIARKNRSLMLFPLGW